MVAPTAKCKSTYLATKSSQSTRKLNFDRLHGFYVLEVILNQELLKFGLNQVNSKQLSGVGRR
jgi:hypothetical protein